MLGTTDLVRVQKPKGEGISTGFNSLSPLMQDENSRGQCSKQIVVDERPFTPDPLTSVDLRPWIERMQRLIEAKVVHEDLEST